LPTATYTIFLAITQNPIPHQIILKSEFANSTFQATERFRKRTATFASLPLLFLTPINQSSTTQTTQISISVKINILGDKGITSIRQWERLVL
jgi:hypothetical protein